MAEEKDGLSLFCFLSEFLKEWVQETKDTRENYLWTWDIFDWQLFLSLFFQQIGTK